jgi:hypothetical protein
MSNGLTGLRSVGSDKVIYSSPLSDRIEYIGSRKVSYASPLSERIEYIGNDIVEYRPGYGQSSSGTPAYSSHSSSSTGGGREKVSRLAIAFWIIVLGGLTYWIVSSLWAPATMNEFFDNLF